MGYYPITAVCGAARTRRAEYPRLTGSVSDDPATAKSLVAPKTHTPGSRLQERGLRYYSPEIVGWESRDPTEQGVAGGIGIEAN
jgi:hypothetical protein